MNNKELYTHCLELLFDEPKDWDSEVNCNKTEGELEDALRDALCDAFRDSTVCKQYYNLRPEEGDEYDDPEGTWRITSIDGFNANLVLLEDKFGNDGYKTRTDISEVILFANDPEWRNWG